jgi:photosystem II stability/assembly factor-like uncharacterized protein
MRKYFVIGLCLLALQMQAQKIGIAQFKNMKPRSIGPASMSGRVTAIDAVVENPNIIYLGTASGGVWKTENSGTTWQSIFDEQPILNIGAVAIQQSNPAVVWVGTGEGNPRNSLNLGGGIYKTLDGGKNWKMMGLEKTMNIHRIIIDPTNPQVVYAAAIGNPYAEHPERGVYKTTDGGENWSRILYTNDTSGCADLVMDPSNPNKLLANMWQHRRTPYSFKSGGPGSGFYVTYDAGKNWKKLGKDEGLPDGDYGRIGIAIAPSQPKVIYALIESKKNGLYRTEDGGFKWELVNSKSSDVTNRPFYFQDIRVDSKNENRVYNVYQMISLSEDGGRNFKIIIPYNGIHPDHHAFWIHPHNPDLIIDGNDGGIGISRDRGKSWMFNEQLPLGQFYHINVDNQTPYNIMGGMQDNGSWRGPSYTWIEGGIRNYYWQGVGGGDGFDVSPDPENPDWVYAMSQGGFLGKYNVKTGEDLYLRPVAPEQKERLRFNWNAAFAQAPEEPGTIYYGSQFVHKSTDKGMTWQIISPDLTTNDTLQQKQDENGGLSVDITGAENFNTIIAIEPSRLDKNILWVGTDDGNVQLTRDGGKTWTNFRGKIPGMPLGAWIPQIRASRYNAAEAFVVCNDYRRGDMKPYLFRTRNYGQTWEPLVDDKKVKGYALCLIQDPTTPGLIFVGTENGLWVSLDEGLTFEQWKHGYPNVSTYDMAIQEREADLCIATFGRAIYVLDDIRPLRKAAAANAALAAKRLTVFDAPTAYQARYRNVAGYDWSSWGLYEGENRKRGAAISYFINHPQQKASTPATAKTSGKPGTEKVAATVAKKDSTKTNTPKLDSVQIKIYDAANVLQRTIRQKADSGYNRYFWGFETSGRRRPGSEKPKPGDNEPGGMIQVFPGTYKVVISAGNEADSTLLTVSHDPLLSPDKKLHDARVAINQRMDKSTDKLVAITDRIAEAEETVSKIEASLKSIDNPAADSLRKAGKAITDSLKNLRYFVMGKPQEKQGYGTPYQPTANGKLQEARFAIFGKDKIPATQEIAMIENAEKMVTEAVEKVNTFFNGRWKKYQQQAEATPISLFKTFSNLE